MTGPDLGQAREALGLSQTKLAAALSVAQSTVTRWEADARPIPEWVEREVLRMVAAREAVVRLEAQAHETCRSMGHRATLEDAVHHLQTCGTCLANALRSMAE